MHIAHAFFVLHAMLFVALPWIAAGASKTLAAKLAATLAVIPFAFGAVVTKDISTIAAKWSARAQAAGPDYTAGVKNTQKDWAGLTAAAADNYSAGVSAAVSSGRFAKGVNAAGTAKWQAAASTKGAQRYPSGVAAGAPAYNAGFAPYLAVIQATTLPPRSPAGSPNNIQRVSAITSALRAKKIGG